MYFVIPCFLRIRMDSRWVLAMAYVPWQHLQTVYEPEYGLDRGTIFPELDKPFLAGGCCNG